jgi:hypothetical protein
MPSSATVSRRDEEDREANQLRDDFLHMRILLLGNMETQIAGRSRVRHEG